MKNKKLDDLFVNFFRFVKNLMENQLNTLTIFTVPNPNSIIPSLEALINRFVQRRGFLLEAFAIPSSCYISRTKPEPYDKTEDKNED